MRMHDLEVLFNSKKGKKGFVPSLQALESREVPAGNLVGSFSIDRRFINEGIKHQYGVSICWLSTKSELLSFFSN